jgi:hypothetical protein
MKPQDLSTMIASAATPSQCTILILMDVGHQRIGRIILEHLRKREIKEHLIKDSPSTIREATHPAAVVVTTEPEAHTQSDLCTACSTVAKPTIAPKIAPYSMSLKEKWNKIPISLHKNQHREVNHTMQWTLHHQQYSPSYP